MSVLAVIDRELRSSARKPITWRVRVLIPGLAFLFCAFALWVVTLFGGRPIPGGDLYQALSWISFGCTMLIGASITADSVSEEKREGTLGLLFLTPLRGYHIALGKFLSSGIAALYSLVAVFPILAIPLLMGGVGGKQLLMTFIALLASATLALCLGLFISTIALKPWKAAGFALFLVSFFSAGLPAIAAAVQHRMHRPDIAQYIFAFSPSYLLTRAGNFGWGLTFSEYWQSLLAITVLALLLLIAISFILPHVWKDRPGSRFTLKVRHWIGRWRYGAGTHRVSLRARLLKVNPFTWLASRQRWASSGFALFTIIVLLLALYLGKKLARGSGDEEFFISLGCFSGAMVFLQLGLIFRIAVLACDRFSTDRKSGALELLLSTPLTVKQILRGQWIALARHLWAGVFLLICGEVVLLYWIANVGHLETGHPYNLWKALSVIVQHLRGGEVPFYWEDLMIIFVPFLACLLLAYCWFPLGWLSMWLGLRMAVQIRAPWFAVILIYLPPWPVFGATMGMLEHYDLFPADNFSTFLVGITIAISFVLLNATFWMWWARRQLLRKFRMAATDRYSLFKRGWLTRLLLGRPNPSNL